MVSKTREEMLEDFALHLLKEVYKLRVAEKIWHVHFGSTNRLNLKKRQDAIDKILSDVGIDEYTNFSTPKFLTFPGDQIFEPLK